MKTGNYRPQYRPRRFKNDVSEENYYNDYDSYNSGKYNGRRNNYSDDGTSTHYGKDRDDAYVRAIGYKEGYLREEDDYPTYSRYDNAKMNSRRYNDKYDEPASGNYGDRYQRVSGDNNNRYNTFNDDRDYYRGYKEFHNDDQDALRWRGKRIRRTYWGMR